MPQWPRPWEIAPKNRCKMELFPYLIHRGNAEEKCQKCVNTRENAHTHAPRLLRLQAAPHARSIVFLGNFWCRSFSLVKVSQKCSQLIHMRFVPVLASGLETRNPFWNRQEKNEFYFSSRQKIFLTKKLNSRVRGKTEEWLFAAILARHAIAIDQWSQLRTNLINRVLCDTPELTGMACARNFPARRAPHGSLSKSKCSPRPRKWQGRRPTVSAIPTGRQCADFFYLSWSPFFFLLRMHFRLMS